MILGWIIRSDAEIAVLNGVDFRTSQRIPKLLLGVYPEELQPIAMTIPLTAEFIHHAIDTPLANRWETIRYDSTPNVRRKSRFWASSKTTPYFTTLHKTTHIKRTKSSWEMILSSFESWEWDLHDGVGCCEENHLKWCWNSDFKSWFFDFLGWNLMKIDENDEFWAEIRRR